MSRARGKLSPRLGEVMTTIFQGEPERLLVLHAANQISAPTFSRLKKGQVPLDSTIRLIAAHFGERIVRHYGEEITRDHGDCTPATILAWLFTVCEKEADQVAESAQAELLRGYRGAENLPAEDIFTLDAIVGAFVAERRRARGLE